MSSPWQPSEQPTDEAAASSAADDVLVDKPAEIPPEENVADVGPDHEPADPSQSAPAMPSRPGLQRNTSIPSAPAGAAPAPPVPMPPPPPSAQPPNDSLSLMQLRRIVAEFKKPEPVAYDFEYQDAGPREEEIDEWFSYQFWQWIRLNAAQSAFEAQWDLGKLWHETDYETRASFARERIDSLQSADSNVRLEAARSLLYLALGRWVDTAGPPASTGNKRCAASAGQLAAMKDGVAFLASLGAYEIVWQAIQNCFHVFWSDDALYQTINLQDAHDELITLMTILYIAVTEVLNDPEALHPARKTLLGLNPSLANFMSVATAKIRWDESNALPLTQILLLLWKSILLVFGGIEDINEVKKAVREGNNDEKNDDIITSSPLDYHVFRQELTSKYPAYIPPQPVIPLETDNTTLLPPIVNQPTKSSSAGIYPADPHSQSGGASILHQPVHIATPAPSPPPSPGVGGKGGKKQNYQTNQNFPFMYPPLDATSNSAGGKGIAGLQDTLVGRKWEGSDIPASILEAGELFSRRVRMSRPTRQLWDEREKFMKSERGWDYDLGPTDGNDDADDDELDPDIDPERDLGLDLSEMTVEERQIIAELREEGAKKKKNKGKGKARSTDAEPKIDLGKHTNVDEVSKQRLLIVENFYHELLPHLQSLVMVLLKPIFVHVTILAQNPPPQQHPGMAGRGAPPNNGPGLRQGQQDSSAPGGGSAEPPELSPEERDATRTREIINKAVTGILLLLLKWFKVSHVLQFEFLAQLLFDHSYLPLILKLFAHGDVQQMVDSNMDRVENSFFHFCNNRSKAKETPAPADQDTRATQVDPATEGQEEEEEDDAMPPPIKRRRSPEESSAEAEATNDAESAIEDGSFSGRPEVDELGHPVNPLPQEPITDFCRRNFFSLINYLRILQKLCKRKAHRNLQLVQYKSSNILRKSLKVPQPLLRLYTLKLFKNQVPYCGRKWRQSNMRVITAVYLHVRPELRDEWLAGSDVDAEVDSSLPLEQALRSLTHWFNVTRYPEQVAGDEMRSALRVEQGFFTRELEKLGMNWQEGTDENPSMASGY